MANPAIWLTPGDNKHAFSGRECLSLSPSLSPLLKKGKAMSKSPDLKPPLQRACNGGSSFARYRVRRA